MQVRFGHLQQGQFHEYDLGGDENRIEHGCRDRKSRVNIGSKRDRIEQQGPAYPMFSD